jgi:hypothetical protein
MEQLDSFFSVFGVYLWVGLAAIMLLLALWLLALQIRLNRATARYRQLTQGVEQGNLEDALAHHAATLATVAERTDDINTRLGTVEKGLAGAVQRIGIVRFNPFNDTGGDQSFSIALLDARGDGLVLSSLFSRSDTRVFAKPIQAGGSKYTLSEEESRAIKVAAEVPVPAS